MKYSLEVYDVKDKRATLIHDKSDTPFPTFKEGDTVLIQVEGFEGKYKVNYIEHILWNATEPKHKLMVFIEYVQPL